MDEKQKKPKFEKETRLANISDFKSSNGKNIETVRIKKEYREDSISNATFC